jgi:hypothetical protein
LENYSGSSAKHFQSSIAPLALQTTKPQEFAIMINSINSAQVTNVPAASNTSPRYPENLEIIADSADRRSSSFGKYTDQQILEASKKLNAQEYAAFGHFGNDASSQGIAKLATAYINYINSLQPEEQNSGRYAGTKESMTALLAAANAQIAAGPDTGNKPVQPKSLIEMVLDAMMKNLQKNGINVGTSANAANSGVQVTISDEARNISNQA